MTRTRKYFTHISFTIDKPVNRGLSKEMLELRLEQLHRPDPELTFSEIDALSVSDISEDGKVVAYGLHISCGVSYEYDENRIQRIEAWMGELVSEFKAYANSAFPVQAYLTLHRDYINQTIPASS